MPVTKLSDLTSAGSLASGDLFYVVQTAGVGGKKATLSQLATLLGSSFLGLTAQAADSAKLGGTAAASFLLASTAASTYQTQSGMSAYQLALVSGTSIKTVGGVSLLGSGDVSVGGGGDMLLGTAQEVTAAKTFDVSTLLLKGSTSGTSTLNAAAVAGTTTFTLPGSSGTLALLSDIPSLSGYETTSHASSTYQTLAGMSGYLTTSGTAADSSKLGGTAAASYLLSATAASTYLALSGGTLTGSLTLGGNISAAAWTTAGIKLKGGGSTLTDTTSSGTVALAVTNKLGGNTIAASSATTYTDYGTLYLDVPAAGTNVTITNPWSLIASGAMKSTALTLTGGTLTLNGATSGASVLSAPAVAGSATITLPGVTSTLATLGANTFTALQTITVGAANTGVLASTGYSLTGSDATSMVNLAGTWNTSGTPTAIKINVTDTASNASSLLLDLQVGGTSKFNAGKNGVTTQSGSVHGTLTGGGTSINYYTGGLRTGATNEIAWTNGNANSATDLVLYRDASGTLAQRNGANAQTMRTYRSFTDLSNFSRLTHGWNTTTALVMAEGAGTGSDGSVAFNDAALATNATVGFIMIPSCAGTPSGTPADIPTGQIPLVWDSTNLKLYAYTGGAWKSSAAFT